MCIYRKGRLKIRKKVELKYGFGPYSNEVRQKIRKEVEKKMWIKIRARIRYQNRKVHFEKNRVKLFVAEYYSKKRRSFLASQLIRHFKPAEIRRAAAKYLRLKEKYGI